MFAGIPIQSTLSPGLTLQYAHLTTSIVADVRFKTKHYYSYYKQSLKHLSCFILSFLDKCKTNLREDSRKYLLIGDITGGPAERRGGADLSEAEN